GEFDDVAQDYWRSVGGDFDDVVGRVGVGLGKVRDDDFIDPRTMWGRAPSPVRLSRRLSSGLDSWRFAGEGARDTRFEEFAEGRPARLKIMLEPKRRHGNRARFGAGEAHNADPSAAGWRGDGDNSVVKIQLPDCI